ncbi:MAG TPA: mechanosensitive ion channel family protein [Kofleriaceae bacterium]|nr:mechanosensitive ion channel family protein [Kofleriaceae bacterium]
MTEYMPKSLLQLGPWGLAYWQWLGIAIVVVLAFIAGRVAARFVFWIGTRVVSRTHSTLDDEALVRLNRPMRFLGKIILVRLMFPLLELPRRLDAASRNVLLAALGVGVIWSVVCLIDVVSSRLSLAEWAKARPASRSLLLLASRILKVLLVVIATITFLGSFGIPVGSLIAGLGIGGIALAFGAQKTVENLFGALALGIDQPLREGDFVRIENDTMGTVESVGLRSTRVRTQDRTIVTLPNGKLADSKIETFGPRDRVRLATVLNLVYSTTSQQLRDIIAGLERTLRAHPDTYPEDLFVRFLALGGSSLDIEVTAYFAGSDYNKFRAWREEMLLAFLAVVEEGGSSFAFPTRTVHLASLPHVPSAASNIVNS